MSKVIGLHGFLGESSNWGDSVDIAYDLYEESQMPFAKLVKKIGNELKSSTGRNILIGYSLGGRIALEVAYNYINSIDKIIILGAHPGLRSEEERAKRKEWLNKWSKNLETHTREEFMCDWNSQQIFSNDYPISQNYRSNSEISDLLNFFPLSAQRDFRPFIKKHSEKITFCVGERDKKYQELYKEADIQNIVTLKRKGHRLLYPDVLKQVKQMIIKEN